MATEAVEVKANDNEELGKLIHLTNEISKSQKEDSACVKEQLEKIATDAADALKASNDSELARKAEGEKVKELEEKQEALEREFFRNKGSEVSSARKEFSLTESEFKSVNSFLRSSEPASLHAMLPEIKKVNQKHAEAIVSKYYPHVPASQIAEFARKYWVEGDDTQGGYLVRPEFSDRFITRDLNSASVRPWVNVIPMRTAEMLIPIDDDISIRGVWEGELGNVPVQTTAKIGQARLVAKQLKVNVPASHEFLEDAFLDAERFVMDKVDLRFMLSENDAVINGTGAQELKGILEYDDWSAPGVYTQNAIERIVTAVAGVIAYDDIVDMQTALPGRYRANAVWFMGRVAWGEILKIKGTDGQPLLKPMDGFREGFRGATLLGYPVVILDQLPGVATDAEPIILGDYKQALTLGDRLTTAIIRDIYTDDSVVKFKARKRMGFLLTSYDGIKILKVQ